METTATDRARGLVERARRRAIGHEAAGALLAGLILSALLAAAAAATARILGGSPGPWLLAALAPGAALAVLRFRRRSPSRMCSALLLDRAAGTKERFAAVLCAKDEEVRDLAASQALSAPSLANGAMPLTFPPSTEGLLAAVSVVLLGAVLLTGGGDEPPPAAGPAPAGAPLVTAARPPDDPNAPADPASEPTSATPTRDPEEILARMEKGSDLSEADWKELERRGLTEEARDAAEVAAGTGDAAAAAEAVRKALADAAGGPPSPLPDPAQAWAAYEAALEAPIWSPRFDAVVRRYFEGAER